MLLALGQRWMQNNDEGYSGIVEIIGLYPNLKIKTIQIITQGSNPRKKYAYVGDTFEPKYMQVDEVNNVTCTEGIVGGTSQMSGVHWQYTHLPGQDAPSDIGEVR